MPPNFPIDPTDGVSPARYYPVTQTEESSPDNRDPKILTAVVSQFQVETQPRYEPTTIGPRTVTWCNIFLTDVITAMDIEAPRHWMDDDGDPATPHNGTEWRANQLCNWFTDHGPMYGWEPTDEAGAVAYANCGKLAVITWKSDDPAESGHVAVVMPTPAGSPTLSAQAGKTCFNGRPYTAGFGSRPVQWWRHP